MQLLRKHYVTICKRVICYTPTRFANPFYDLQNNVTICKRVMCYTPTRFANPFYDLQNNATTMIALSDYYVTICKRVMCYTPTRFATHFVCPFANYSVSATTMHKYCVFCCDHLRKGKRSV